MNDIDMNDIDMNDIDMNDIDMNDIDINDIDINDIDIISWHASDLENDNADGWEVACGRASVRHSVKKLDDPPWRHTTTPDLPSSLHMLCPLEWEISSPTTLTLWPTSQ